MRRRRDERGVTLIEAAFVLPIVFMVLLGMMDFGDWVFTTTQATHAARDGARQGILTYYRADLSGSSDQNAINAAAARRLAGQPYTMTVACVPPNSTSVLPDGCSAAIPGCDRIMVQVSWPRTAWSYMGQWFGIATVKGQAEMTIVGLPLAPGSTPPTTLDTGGCP